MQRKQNLKVGDTVTWTSQAGGYEKAKTGTVNAIVVKGMRGYPLLPAGVKKSQIKFDDVSTMSDRVIVAVKRGGKSVLTDYYGPRMSTDFVVCRRADTTRIEKTK